jgi:Zn-dependent protease
MISPRESTYLGHLGPIPIYVHWSAIGMLVLAFMWSQGGREFDLAMFLIVLTVLLKGLVLHELGHGLTARALGATGVTITLWAFGGLCQSQRDQTPGREFLIVAAGPAVSFLLAGLGYGALYVLVEQRPDYLFDTAGNATVLQLFLVMMYQVNLILGIFNMLPIFPLDGGQLVYNGALMFTRRQLLVRQICLTLSVFGALAFVLWQFHNAGNQFTGNVIFSAFIMFWLVSDAWRFLR